MAVCKDLDSKYIKTYEAGFVIRIERAGKIFKKKIPYRKHGGRKKSLEYAKKLRNKKYFELFQTEISKRFFHIKSKSAKGNLPSGLSYGYSRGKLLYIVVSYSDRPNHIVRKRFNINKLGISGAIRSGIFFLNQVRENILKEDL